MRYKYFFFIILTIVILFLSGCEKEPLKFRNLQEADKYLHNNIANMNWKTFDKVLAKNNNVSREEFVKFQKVIKKREKSFHVIIDDAMYRYTKNNELLYKTEWIRKNTKLKLKDVYFIDN